MARQAAGSPEMVNPERPDGCGRRTADAFLIDVAIKGFGDLLNQLAMQVVDFRDGRGAG